jgi:hypothetical protein
VNPPRQKHYTLSKAARILGVSRDVIEAAIVAGKLKRTAVIDLTILEADLIRFADSQGLALRRDGGRQ